MSRGRLRVLEEAMQLRGSLLRPHAPLRKAGMM